MDQLVVIPEFILFNIINRCLNYLRTDYANQTDKNLSFLNMVLNGNSIERYDLATQAKKVFIDNDETNDRFLEVHMMFNMQREGLPTIHLTLPSEQTQTGGNGIGSDEGYKDPVCIDTTYNDDETIKENGWAAPVYTRRFQSTYNIVITSDNSNEVILIYHTLRALLISLIPSISLEGLENVAFGGQDVQLYQGMANKNMYIRAISVTLQYDTSAPNIFHKNFVNDMTAKGKLIEG
jgi:hypothetical protein